MQGKIHSVSNYCNPMKRTLKDIASRLLVSKFQWIWKCLCGYCDQEALMWYCLYGHLWCRSQISGQPTFVITRLRSGSYRKCRLPYPFFGCWNFLPNNNCDVTLVNLIFILVISSKTTSYINLIFQFEVEAENLNAFMAFVSVKAHNLHF